MKLNKDYEERVYAGVLGKIIGVYLGRPFEGWPYQRIMAELGEIKGYVHEKFGLPLVVTDDDIAGTFTFLRALPDYGNDPALLPEQIGQTWLNYVIENRTIFWWGGMMNSTEHTAYLRLKNGIPAPKSGSIELNGEIISQQIGAQIFIDGWGMIWPGDAERAADFARRAASVSHDGEAIYGAQVIAAMEAMAFVEADLGRLLDIAMCLIPGNSVIYRLINDLRDWRVKYPDWRQARQMIVEHYGYDKYPGNCHIVPNHALIHLGLLYGDDDFQKSLMITNTCGWDTDCNSGNVGCLLGIKNGLQGINGQVDWRRPVADRLYLPTADGGRAISDAVQETYHIVNIARALAGQDSVYPKSGARFHFSLPGSVQGFRADVETQGTTASLENVLGHSQLGTRSLELTFQTSSAGGVVRFGTDTFIPPEAIHMPGYAFIASPTLYPGQKMRARVLSDVNNPQPFISRLYIKHYSKDEHTILVKGPQVVMPPGSEYELHWVLDDMGGEPIVEAGVEFEAKTAGVNKAYLDYLTWDGGPKVNLRRPQQGSSMWRRAWVNAVDIWQTFGPEAYRLIQNSGVGLLIQGTRDWRDYRVSAIIRFHLVQTAGLAVCVQGLKRYYAMLLSRQGKLRLVKQLNGEVLLVEQDFPYEEESDYQLCLQTEGEHLQGWVDGVLKFDVQDTENPLQCGGIALICEEGCISCNEVLVSSVVE